jgi:hypothetical protein
MPRAVLIDTEPSVIEKTLKTRTYFNEELVDFEMEGTGGNCVEGHYIKRELQESALDLIRKTAERCNSLQGFFFVNSLNSGTGAGFNEGLTSRIGIDYEK